ncbi:MAG TPA: response regulator [Caulobacterales bacterium]|nr:response regulator [Caulobacterales bacterium]
MSALDPSARINLRRASVLVLDRNEQAGDVVRQILLGFGVRAVHVTDTVEDARKFFLQQTLELFIVDPLLEGGFEFLHWARRENECVNHHMPMIAAMGHQTEGNVRAARDAGANFVVAKPLSADVLLQRIEWIARENRQFIVAPNYVGPDRRFKNEGPPAGCDGRRADDLSLEAPNIAAPNMSQLEVDELLKPRKVAL